MSSIEGWGKPIAIPLIQGHGSLLNILGQAALAFLLCLIVIGWSLLDEHELSHKVIAIGFGVIYGRIIIGKYGLLGFEVSE
jgi:hypothetical protein